MSSRVGDVEPVEAVVCEIVFFEVYFHLTAITFLKHLDVNSSPRKQEQAMSTDPT